MNKKHLPSLSSVLPKSGKKASGAASLAEQRAGLEAISRLYKIPLKVIPAA